MPELLPLLPDGACPEHSLDAGGLPRKTFIDIRFLMNAIHNSSTTALPPKNGPGFFRRNWPLFFVVLLWSTNLWIESYQLLALIALVGSIACLKRFALVKHLYIYILIPVFYYLLIELYHYTSFALPGLDRNIYIDQIVISTYTATCFIPLTLLFIREKKIIKSLQIYVTVFFLSPLYCIPRAVIYVAIFGLT